jgi:cation diffusion facilitator family transporter
MRISSNPRVSVGSLQQAFSSHHHVFLAADHERSERKTWAVIVLCGLMMAGEIIGGILFGSIALVADGLHMSTHAGALLLAALAYSYARKHARDGRFTFGTGKLGDLAGFMSAIVLAMIAILIGYESVIRAFQPVPIHFNEAIPIACLGLAVNVISAWLLSSGGHHHHGHGEHGHGRDDAGHADEAAEKHRLPAAGGALLLEIHEDGVPPRFRLQGENLSVPANTTIETLRPDGSRQVFALKDRGGYLESVEEVPEPHAFTARIHSEMQGEHQVIFEEHHHGHAGAHRDNNMRAAVIHVLADAAVSMLVIVGLVLAKVFGWLWMDPLAGMIGACVIASWSYGLIRDTGAILLDMNPDRELMDKLRQAIESEGDRLDDLHLWRVGPGHLAAILCVATAQHRDSNYYRKRLARYKILSHLTVEVVPLRTS